MGMQMHMQIDMQILGNLIVGFVFLLPCVVWDVRTQLIPGWYLVIGLAAAVAGRIVFSITGGVMLVDTLLCLLPGSFLLLLSFLTQEKIGLGDGVCFLILGLMEGGRLCLLVLLFSFLLSSVFSIFLLSLRRLGIKKRIPFLPFVMGGMAAGTLCLLI